LETYSEPSPKVTSLIKQETILLGARFGCRSDYWRLIDLQENTYFFSNVLGEWHDLQKQS
jgi:hypothetical protein